MTDDSNPSDLALALAAALKRYAPHASVAERTAVTHLAEQLTQSTDVDFRIQCVNGLLTLECSPISHTTDKRKVRKGPRKSP